jgi:hypothetical protein
LILLNAQRQLWRVDGYFPEPHKYVTDALGLCGDGWKILGWRMADASMPLGDYDAIDPDLAQFDYLPVPNSPEARRHSIPPDGGSIDRSDSESVASR